MRPKFFTFWKTLKEWCLLIDGREPSTNKRYHKLVNQDAARIGWWYEADAVHSGETTRNLAYLTAYVEVFGPRLSMKGLGVHEGWVYADRAIMRSLHETGFLAVENEAFILTDAGREQIAPWLVEQGGVFCRVSSAKLNG